MNLPELGNISEYMRIPKAFRSSETGKPLSHCLVCGGYLLETGTHYQIEKTIKQHHELKLREVMFEYAICMPCALAFQDALSVESRQRIQAYFTQVDFVGRRNRLLARETLTVSPWINRCLIKDTPIRQSPEYQITAQCNGPYLLFTYMPFALSMAAMEEISNLLSAKSRGEMDDFIGRHFSGPPEIAVLLKRRLALV